MGCLNVRLVCKILKKYYSTLIWCGIYITLTGELFAKSLIDQYPGVAVEAVLDSSRYFVIKIQDDTGYEMFLAFILSFYNHHH